MKKIFPFCVLILGFCFFNVKGQIFLSGIRRMLIWQLILFKIDTIKIPGGLEGEAELLVRFDKGFEKELIRLGIDKLGKTDGLIRYSDVKDIEHLTVVPQIKEGIQSLKGIEYFVNLRSFTTLYTKPDSLDFGKNTKLEYLRVQTGYEVAGERKTLKYLNVSNCKQLKYLDCQRNSLERLDLRQNVLLKELYCADNYSLMSLDLSFNTELEVLKAPDHETFLDLDLSKNLKLRKLFCYATGLQKLDLSMLNEISVLLLSSGSLNLTVGSLPKLDTLGLAGRTMESFNFNSTPNLRWLNLTNGSKSVDLTPLKKLKGLTFIKSNFSRLDLTANRELESLGIQKTEVLELNLTENVNLRTLYGYDWKSITDLDLRACRNLEKCIILNSPKLLKICVSVLPNLSDTNWAKPAQANFQVCN